MIAPLSTVFNLTKLHMRIMRRINNDIAESLRQNMLGTGARDQVSTGLDHLHGTKVNLFITSCRTIDCRSSLGEGRRVEDHNIVFRPISTLFTQEIKCVSLNKVDPILQMIQLGVLCCKGACIG